MHTNTLQYIKELPKLAILLLCLILVIIIGIIDYDTGDYIITVVYIIPIYLVARFIGSVWCLITTVLCILEIVSVVTLSHRGHISVSEIYVWNALIQSFELAVAGYCISKITAKSA